MPLGVAKLLPEYGPTLAADPSRLNTEIVLLPRFDTHTCDCTPTTPMPEGEESELFVIELATPATACIKSPLTTLAPVIASVVFVCLPPDWAIKVEEERSKTTPEWTGRV